MIKKSWRSLGDFRLLGNKKQPRIRTGLCEGKPKTACLFYRYRFCQITRLIHIGTFD